MTQWEFDTISMLIQTGAPAFTQQLGLSFKNLVDDYLRLKKLEEEQKSLEENQEVPETAEEE